jgi:translation initiation factor IF-1
MTSVPNEPERAKRAPEAATVVATLPNGQFRLRTQDGRNLVAHVAKDLRMAFTRLVPGDLVGVEVSPFDRAKARIECLL